MITFHRACNLGANLQAYALNKFINENIAPCEIIDFYPNNQTAHKNKVRKILSEIKSMIPTIPNKKMRKFKNFQNKNYILSNKTYYGDDQLERSNLKYDILLSGSDQIFNTQLSDTSKSYYLNFDENSKKVSYASSFGREELSEDELSLIESELPKFSHLSFREQSGAELVKEKLGISASLVLDPVFLLNNKEWDCVAAKESIEGDFIFVYAMEESDELLETVKAAKEKYKLPVYVVYGGENKGFIDGVEISDCGPQEFLSYIKESTIIITNSFHGTAFSIIYGKNFLSVAHSTRNARLRNIMSLIKCEGKLVNYKDISDIDEYTVDGTVAFGELISYIDNSKKYLYSACEKQ